MSRSNRPGRAIKPASAGPGPAASEVIRCRTTQRERPYAEHLRPREPCQGRLPADWGRPALTAGRGALLRVRPPQGVPFLGYDGCTHADNGARVEDLAHSRRISAGNAAEILRTPPTQPGLRSTFDVAAQQPPAPLGPRWQALLGLGALAFAGVALALGFTDHPVGPWDAARAIGSALAIALPVVVGLYAVRHGQAVRFAWLLIAVGLGYAPVALAMSSDSLPYSIGRVAGWGV